MKRIFRTALATILAVSALATGALAMPVHIEGGALVANGTDVRDGDAVEIRTADFQLLGRDGAGKYLIYADGKLLSVPLADVKDVLEMLGDSAEALPDLGDFREIGRGSKDPSVAELQEALIALGYLSGPADGDFGGNSQRAISDFQKDMGIKQTGVADAMTQMLAYSSAQETVEIVPGASAEESFAPIMGKADGDLSCAIELGLRLEYDDIAGVGEISNGNAVVYEVPALSDIDRCTVTVRAVLCVEPGESGKIEIRPALKLSCLCVRRPVMQEVILKSGEARETIKVEGLDSALDGVQSLETGTAWLDDAALEILSNAAEARELKIRVACKYGSYDIEVPAKTLRAVANVALAAKAL